MKVGDVMTRGVLAIRPTTFVRDAVQRMEENNLRHLLVLQEGVLVGVLSSRDIPSLDGAAMPVQAHRCMSKDVVTIGPDEPLLVAAARMGVHKIGCLPVVEGGKVVGIVTTYDLLEVLVSVLSECGDGG